MRCARSRTRARTRGIRSCSARAAARRSCAGSTAAASTARATSSRSRASAERAARVRLADRAAGRRVAAPDVRQPRSRRAPLRRCSRRSTPRSRSMPAMPERASAEIRDVAGNWKQHAWNYLDQFHIGFVHRAPRRPRRRDRSRRATRPSSTATPCCSGSTRATPTMASIPRGCPTRFADPKGRRVFALWWFVFPNLALSFYPWGLSVNVYRRSPIAPDAHALHLVPVRARSHEARRARLALAVVAGRRRGRRRARAGQPRPALGLRAAPAVRSGARAGRPLVPSRASLRA